MNYRIPRSVVAVPLRDRATPEAIARTPLRRTKEAPLP